MTATDEARLGAPAVRTCELFVGGRWTAAEHGRTVQTRSELTGKPVAEVAAASPADVRRAVEAAERGFGTWAGWPPARRRAVLERAAALFAERADDLASLMREEMGAARPWCEFNVSVARVNFTGSTRVGRVIAEIAGRHLTRTVLELGGNAPMLVLGDADLQAAVDAAAFGAFLNQGQVCMSTERLIVDRSVADEVAVRLAERAAGLVVGPPDDPSTQLGPMVSREARDRVLALVDDAREHGAEVLTGGEAEGLYVRPTVLRGVTPAMRIYSEESFGPVLSIIEADGTDHAVEIANDTEYGLSAAVFSRDAATALELARRVRSGICHVNGPTVHDEPQMPFGGVGASGWGRFGSRAALEEFTELRWITVQAGQRHYPF